MNVLLQQPCYRRQRDLAVAYDSHIADNVLVYLGRVYVEVDNLGLLGICRRQSCYPIAKSHSYGNEHVALLCFHVGCITAMHAEHAHIKRMSRWQGRQSQQRSSGRDIGFLQKLHKLVVGATQLHSLSNEGKGSLGCVDDVGGIGYSLLVNLRIRIIRPYMVNMHGLPLAAVNLRILREVEHHWSRSSAPCNIERPAYSPCHILRPSYLVCPLCYRLRHTHEVNLLEGVGSQCSRAHLSGNDDNGSRVHHGISHSRKGIGNAWSARHEAYSHLAANSGIALCGMCGGLLMAHQNMVKLLVIPSRISIKGIKDRHYGTTRVAKYSPYALFNERAHQCLGTCYDVGRSAVIRWSVLFVAVYFAWYHKTCMFSPK